MLRKSIITFMAGAMLLAGGSVFAFTLDEAKANIDKQATEKKLGAADHSQATAVLQDLVNKGVPVEHAYNVVNASINEGIKGKDLAEIAKSIEANQPGARKGAADVAATAINHKYTAKETVKATNTYRSSVASGTLPDKAADNAKLAMDKDRTRTGDRDRDRDRDRDHDRQMTHDHMGDGSGMGHDMGGGMGPGSGVGGPRR